MYVLPNATILWEKYLHPVLAACTCPGESHPGPMREDGSYVGRSAPEIDVMEATVIDSIGYVRIQLFVRIIINSS